MGVDQKEFCDAVKEQCVLTCRDFLHQELPDLALDHPARYLATLIEGGLPEGLRGLRERFRVLEETSDLQCVRVRIDGRDRATVVLGINLPREEVERAVRALRGSNSEERYFLYLFSFAAVSDEGSIGSAVMEPELLNMVRDSGIVAYFAMLDPRAGMGMMARIDGDLRSIEYLPH